MRLPIAFAAAAALAACGLSSASAETRSYSLSGFKQIRAASSTNVVLKQGPYSVVAESRNGGDFKDLVVELDGDALVVHRESRNWGLFGHNYHYVVTVTAPDISELHASSSADIDADNYTFKDLKVSATSSGDVRLSGTCGTLDVDATSSGDFKGKDLRCESARANATSSGDVDLYATKSVVGRASSSGDVRVYGNPPQLDSQTSSSGKVKKAS